MTGSCHKNGSRHPRPSRQRNCLNKRRLIWRFIFELSISEKIVNETKITTIVDDGIVLT